MKNEYYPSDSEREIISMLTSEMNSWGEGEVFLTDKVSFVMKNIWKKARKNYFGVYDNPIDPVTGRKKLFVPATEWTVETVVKNIDIDTSDIGAIAKNGNYKSAALFRHVLSHVLDKARFGITLNKLIRWMAIDGTSILKAWADGGNIKIRVIDRANIICDPSAETLDESSAVIERNVLTLPEFEAYKYDNIEYVSTTKNVDRTGFMNKSLESKTEIPYVEVYERYGYLPERLVDEKSDSEKYVYALVVASGIENGTPIIHKVKKVTSHPYQEFKFKEILNRFDGRGIGEMLFDINAYLNETANIRLNTNRIGQSGLWEIRGNITPQQLKKLFSTSAIKTSNEGDIQQIPTKTVDMSSYRDEETAYSWAQRVTQAQREDELASNAPATNALIQERGSAKSYELVMESVSLNLSKFIEEKIVPLIVKTMKEGDIIAITGDPGELMKLQEPFVKNYVFGKLLEYKYENGFIPLSREEIEAQIESLNEELSKQGDTRMIQYAKAAFDTDYIINVTVKESPINRSVMANQLIQTMGILTSAGIDPKDTLKELFDLMGLDSDKLTETKQLPQAGDQQRAMNPSEPDTVPMPAGNQPNPTTGGEMSQSI